MARLITPENLAKAQDILKQAGISIQFKDPRTGQTVDIKSKEDVKTIKTKDGRELKEGADYKFENGKLIFHNVPQKQTITITRPDGTTFDIDVEPDKLDQKAHFIPNAQGQFHEIDDNVDLDKAFQEQQERDRAHRVTISFGDSGVDFDDGQVVAIGFKTPDGHGMALPKFAWEDEDGVIAFDVQALGDKTPPPPPGGGTPHREDLTQRTWVLVVKFESRFKVYKFKITKALEQADMPDVPPGQPIDFSKVALPAAQKVEPGDIKFEGAAEYGTEADARAAENLHDPGEPPPQG